MIVLDLTAPTPIESTPCLACGASQPTAGPGYQAEPGHPHVCSACGAQLCFTPALTLRFLLAEDRAALPGDALRLIDIATDMIRRKNAAGRALRAANIKPTRRRATKGGLVS